MIEENEVRLTGMLIGDPTIKESETGNISRARILTRDPKKNVITVIAFGSNADKLHNLGRHGSKIQVIGRLESVRRKVDDERSINTTSCVVDRFFVDTKNESEKNEEDQEG